MKLLRWGLAALLVTSCGLFRELEPETPTVKADAPKESCTFPDQNTLLDYRKIPEEIALSAIDCAEKNLELAFKKIHGATPNEISYEEARTLQKKGIVNLGIEDERLWQIIKHTLPLFHPQKREALSKPVVDAYIAWLKKRAPFIVKSARLIGTYDPEINSAWLASHELSETVSELIDLLNTSFDLSLERALLVATLGYDYAIEHKSNITFTKAQLRGYIEGFWILKNFILSSNSEEGTRTNITGKAVKGFLTLATDLQLNASQSVRWGFYHASPRALSHQITLEWNTLASIVQRYIQTNTFQAIDKDSLSWAIRKLSPKSPLSELTGDLVRISQHLSPKGLRHPGIHPISLLKFLSRANILAQEIEEGATAVKDQCFLVSPNYEKCFISIRQALNHPLLNKIALKGALNDTSIDVKRFDNPIRWNEVVERLALRSIMISIFDAFDSQGSGNIPITGNTEEELKDILDLAYTFLRFASISKNPTSKEGTKEVSIPTPIMVKPDKVAKVMGLIGDKWMNDGNKDGKMNAEEFFSVTQVYEDIERNANWAFNKNNSQRYCKFDSLTGPYCTWSDATIRSRKEFIQAQTEIYYKAHVTELLKSLPNDIRDSFFHALVGVPKRKELKAVKVLSGEISPPLQLQHYIEADATLAPSAVLLILERLMHRCDADEDNTLNWKELDCAAPLVLEVAHETVSSQLIDLDPGVNDGSKVLLGFLQTKGLPLSLAKLVFINGSIKKNNLGESTQVNAFLESELTLDWNRIAEFIGGKPGAEAWVIEAKKRFGKCDTSPKDGYLKGKGELDCFANTVVDSALHSLSEALKMNITPATLEQMTEYLKSESFFTFLLLSTQSENELNNLLSKANLSSGPIKMVHLMEEIIRRSVPLWQIQD